MPALHPAARILPPATRQSAVVPAPGFRRAQAPRRWRAELEAADLATADHAFHVVDAAAGGRLHVGEVELADLRMLPGQAVENAVERLHLRSEEHTSELQSLMRISYAVFCLKKKK